MCAFELDQTVEYYRSKLAEHGPGAKGMDWKDESAQRLRFDMITRHIDFSTAPSVLDVGCGSGEFLAVCKERGRDIRYLGIDIVPEMVEACRERFGEDTAVVASVQEFALGAQRFDYVIAAGTFNLKLDRSPDEWREYLHTNIEAMFSLCNVATIVNLLSHFVDYTYDRIYYATPQEIAELAIRRLSQPYVIDQRCTPWDMTAVIYRSPCGPPEVEPFWQRG